MTAYGLMFHHFHDDGLHVRGQGSINNNEFKQILLKSGIENFLTPAEWLKKVESGSLLPNHRCITFDDALKTLEGRLSYVQEQEPQFKQQ
jgi:hypothetical protein